MDWVYTAFRLIGSMGELLTHSQYMSSLCLNFVYTSFKCVAMLKLL